VMVLALALAMSPAAVLGLTQPSVSLDDDEISAYPVEYSIVFTLGDDVAIGDDIIVVFPDGTDLTNVQAADVTIAATSGIGSAPITAGTFSVVKSPDATEGPELTATVTGLTGDTMIGVGAMVQLKVDDVKNPDSPGDYTLEVSTTNEDDAVESTSYTIGVPTIPPLPGIVEVYNTNDILMAQYTGSTAIAQAETAAGVDYLIVVGPGTYVEDIDVNVEGVTIEASGAAEDTIIEGDWDLDEDGITLSGLTFKGEMDVYGDSGDADITIENCIFEKLDDTIGETLLYYDGYTAAITDCIFDSTEGAEDDYCIEVDYDGLTISGCSFTIDEDDEAIYADYDVTIEDCEFTGSSGFGIDATDDIVNVDACTFDGLENALYLDGVDELYVTGCTIMNSTGDAIYVDGIDDWFVMTSTTIEDTDEDYYALYIEDDGDYVYAVFNSFIGNELNVFNESGYDANLTNNWWGDVDGPAADSIVEDDSDSGILTTPYLGAPVEAAAAAAWSDALDAKTACGVKVTTDATGGNEPEVLAAALYESNPKTATPYPVLNPYVDIYMSDPGDAEEVVIRIYHDGIDDDTVVLVWNDLQGEWVECSDQGASTFGGYVWCKIGEEDSLPIFEDMTGIPFVLATAPAAPVSLNLTSPAAGATGVIITNVAFTWQSIAIADSYTVKLSANADLSSPIVTATGLPGTAYTCAEALDYSAPYYWQVSAYDEEGLIAKSDVAAFTTMAEPVDPGPPVVIEMPPAQEAPIVEVTEITPAWIWALIGIGAVLVIALIVLIVRTRRAV